MDIERRIQRLEELLASVRDLDFQAAAAAERLEAKLLDLHERRQHAYLPPQSWAEWAADARDMVAVWRRVDFFWRLRTSGALPAFDCGTADKLYSEVTDEQRS